MGTGRIKLRIVLAALLVVIAMVTPAMAGKVTVRNLHATKSYYVKYERWTLGFMQLSGICADPGEVVRYDDIVESTGKITVHYTSDNKCSSGTFKSPVLKQFTPSGTYLPHRTFTVIIQTDGQIFINED